MRVKAPRSAEKHEAARKYKEKIDLENLLGKIDHRGNFIARSGAYDESDELGSEERGKTKRSKSRGGNKRNQKD